jgi:hypothetical protein
MTHISKDRLKPAHIRKLFSQLARYLKRSQSDTEAVLSELLGEEEQIMLAKRFAAIMMLAEGNSLYRTGQLLDMSPSTVERLRDKMRAGAYDSLVTRLQHNKKAYQDFWKTLEVVLRAGMPPLGRGRWKSIREHLAPRE